VFAVDGQGLSQNHQLPAVPHGGSAELKHISELKHMSTLKNKSIFLHTGVSHYQRFTRATSETTHK
jgi:hypothetical protein